MTPSLGTPWPSRLGVLVVQIGAAVLAVSGRYVNRWHPFAPLLLLVLRDEQLTGL